KMIDKKLLIKLIIAFALGAVQGLMGWIMVSSGLVDQPWVSPIDLSAHLILALVLLCYLLWLALEVLNPKAEPADFISLRRPLIWIIVLLGIQIFYGGLMAGNHAALFYPTFPKFGDKWIPEALFVLNPKISNFFQNVGMIQLIHRTLGTIIGVLVIVFFYWARRKSGTVFFHRSLAAFPFFVLLQVMLGIVTLMHSLGSIPIVPAAAHQFCAVVLLMIGVMLLFQVSHAGKEELKTAETASVIVS
ncbi:MAG: COX15/CtaA family protein, partial [Chitinophagales bacterium]